MKYGYFKREYYVSFIKIYLFYLQIPLYRCLHLKFTGHNEGTEFHIYCGTPLLRNTKVRERTNQRGQKKTKHPPHLKLHMASKWKNSISHVLLQLDKYCPSKHVIREHEMRNIFEEEKNVGPSGFNIDRFLAHTTFFPPLSCAHKHFHPNFFPVGSKAILKKP